MARASTDPGQRADNAGPHGSSTLVRPVVSSAWLTARLDDPSVRVVDCRFDLDDLQHGARGFAAARIPGAVRVDLAAQLSATVVPGRTGRHPLPSVADLEATMAQLGIGPDTRVVAYDDFGGAFAARFWWSLRWLGHDAVAVLDGGWPAWCEAGLAMEQGEPRAVAVSRFEARVRPELLVHTDELLARLGDPRLCLVDARSPACFRGEVRPRDPVAGRIPGARNAFWRDNLGPQGGFRSSAQLYARFEAVLGGARPQDTIIYCGSGVTGAHDLLAMAHGCLPMARLYAGSWSEWLLDPTRPVQRQIASPGVTGGA